MNEIQKYKKQDLTVENTAWNSLAEESRKAYQSDFNLFFDFIKAPVGKITASDILSFIDYLRAKDYKNSTINRKVSSLSRMFNVLKIAGKIKENPVEMLKQFKRINMKVDKEVRIFLTMEEIKRAVKKPKGRDELTSIVIRMLAKTGLRVSELTNIKNKSIDKYDETNLMIRIVGKGQKERFIYIDQNFMDEIKKKFPEGKSEYLFYTNRKNKMSRQNIYSDIRDFFFRKIGKRVHPHMLRHTFITHKISNEKQDIRAVSRYAGHQSCQTTLDMYVDKTLNGITSMVKI